MGRPRRGASKNAKAEAHTNKKDTTNNNNTDQTRRIRTGSGPGGAIDERRRSGLQQRESAEPIGALFDLSSTLPLGLQQLMLDVFKSALLLFPNNVVNGDGVRSHAVDGTSGNGCTRMEDGGIREELGELPEEIPRMEEQLDVKCLIQTLKSHLYKRDFGAAFAGASGELLRAYALRWSASRTLGYAGIFRSVFKELRKTETGRDSESAQFRLHGGNHVNHVVCIGGGAGAEIVALAGAWRNMLDEENPPMSNDVTATVNWKSVANEFGAVSLEDRCCTETIADENADTQSWQSPSKDAEEANGFTSSQRRSNHPELSVTVVDIADWSAVVDRLMSAIQSNTVPSSKQYPAPLVQPHLAKLPDDAKNHSSHGTVSVNFTCADVLALSDTELAKLVSKGSNIHEESHAGSVVDNQTISTVLVTLMFTLNELFSTSMAKATAFLLRTTNLLQPGTLLLVVDSPGSYSILRLGTSKTDRVNNNDDDDKDFGRNCLLNTHPKAVSLRTPQERHYPMKFLLDHTLLSVATGKWEKVFSQDSRWWRRVAAQLQYEVGEGAGLEDMRYQIHIYRRLAG